MSLRDTLKTFDNDGLVTAGEPGIPGIPVNITWIPTTTAPGWSGHCSTVTDANGNYLFDELLPDTYLVEVVAPSRYTVSTGTGRRWLPSRPFEPAPDPDNDIDNDDNGTLQTGGSIWSLPVTLTAKGEPVDDGDNDFNSNLSVDFGLLTNFDLALRKTLAPGQPVNIQNIGDNVDFVITVFNQGTIAATDITVFDTFARRAWS